MSPDQQREWEEDAEAERREAHEAARPATERARVARGPMTASAAEVEAAQKAMADHSLKACGRHVGEMHECVCGSRFATVSGWSGHQAQAVADAVVAAAQPRIAADERCGVCGGGRVTVHDWAKHEDACVGLCGHGKDPSACPSGCADESEAQP